MSVALAGRSPSTFDLKSANLPLLALRLKSSELETGNCGKPTPHPALRGHLPPKGKALTLPIKNSSVGRNL